MEGVNPVAATGFTAAADVYERARPTYPPEAIDRLAQRVDLRPGRAVVDVGAGTGKLTRLLLPTGAQVIAVEPLPAMLAKLVEAAPGAEALLGTAEAIPLEDASADVITVAQAFHWFDHDRALAEFRRVLRTDGFLALVWNMRDLDDPVQAAVEELIAPARSTANVQRADTWRPPLERSPLFGPLEEWRFPFVQQFTADKLCDRVRSTSFVAAMGDVEREQLLISVRELVREVPEPFPYHYVTEIFVAPVDGSDGARRRG